jgi:multiple sugar transport system permease protein
MAVVTAARARPRRRYIHHYLMLTPFFALFIAFHLAPILYGLGMSLTRWDGVSEPTFVGLQNYLNILRSTGFSKSYTNLLAYVAIEVPLTLTTAFVLALMVERFVGASANLFRSAYFLPTVIPLFLAAAVWKWMLTPDYGIVNVLLGVVGIPSINWLNDPTYMLPALVMVSLWRSTGFNLIILLAGLKAIPQVYYEAAKVDGANTLQQIRHVTIPQLEPVIFLVFVNGFISALQVFDLPWLMTSSSYGSYGGPLQTLMFPVMDVMGRAFGSLRLGEAAAYAVILFLMILLITLAQFVARRRWTD